MNKNIIIIFLALLVCLRAIARDSIPPRDTIFVESVVKKPIRDPNKFDYLTFSATQFFFVFVFVVLESFPITVLNESTRYELYEHQPKRMGLDNYTQYAPAAMVYGLNAIGVKGLHNFRDRTIIYATSQLINAALVIPIKHLVKEERPDGSNNLSSPSGHTATAFSSAQFMFREYKDSNFWLSISGYSFAVFTGVYRTINDRHWVNDVVAGAGFGILSTEMAYWLYPKINHMLVGGDKRSAMMLMPIYQNHSFGIGFVQNF